MYPSIAASPPVAAAAAGAPYPTGSEQPDSAAGAGRADPVAGHLASVAFSPSAFST